MATKTHTHTTAKTLPLGGITLIDKVEKDFGPISKVFSCIFTCFLATSIYNLTVKILENSPVKNLKLLKKFLQNLTLVIIYPKGRFQLRVVSNVTPQIKHILGDFVYRYGDKNLDLRW